MRCEEIGQLLVSDIVEENQYGFPIIDINEFDLENKRVKRLKSSAARRKIPIHPILLDLGLMSYVSEVRAQEHARLFPDLIETRGKDNRIKWTHSYSSHRFPRLRQSRHVEKPFHCFRHTVKAFWVNTSSVVVDVEVQNAILGHSRGHGAGDHYARDARVALERCDAAVRALKFERLPEIQRGRLPTPREQLDRQEARPKSSITRD
jgi:integrase